MMNIHARLVARQSTDELLRKQRKAKSRRIRTQEDDDLETRSWRIYHAERHGITITQEQRIMKTITRVTYLCEICEEEYETAADAIACESKPLHREKIAEALARQKKLIDTGRLRARFYSHHD